MSPKVIAILVIILLVIFGGMALTMKRATDKRRDRTAEAPLVLPAGPITRSAGASSRSGPGPRWC